MGRAAQILSERERSKVAAAQRRGRHCLIVQEHLHRQQRWTREAVADLLGYNDGLLRRRLDPFDSPSLRIEDLVVLTDVCGDELIGSIARDCGGVFVRIEEAPGDAEDARDEAMTIGERVGELAGEVRSATAVHSDGGRDITPTEARRIRGVVRRLLEEGARLDALLRRMEGGQ